MTVSWKRLTLVEARGFVQFYIITINGGGGNTKRQVVEICEVSQDPCLRLVSAASDSATVTGLDPGTGYDVTMAAANGFQSPPSEPPPTLDESSVTVGNSSEVVRVAGMTPPHPLLEWARSQVDWCVLSLPLLGIPDDDDGNGGGGGDNIGIIIAVVIIVIAVVCAVTIVVVVVVIWW